MGGCWSAFRYCIDVQRRAVASSRGVAATAGVGPPLPRWCCGCGLNHHITPFKHMAAITLRDWTCCLNGRINPLSNLTSPPQKSSEILIHPLVQATILMVPIAANVIRQLGLSFVETDMRYITDGLVGIRHLTTLSKALLPLELQIPSRNNITNLEKACYNTLGDFGHLLPSAIPPLSFTFLPFYWYISIYWTQTPPSPLTRISLPSISLLISTATSMKPVSSPCLNIVSPTPTMPLLIPLQAMAQQSPPPHTPPPAITALTCSYCLYI